MNSVNTNNRRQLDNVGFFLIHQRAPVVDCAADQPLFHSPGGANNSNATLGTVVQRDVDQTIDVALYD